MKVYRLYVFVLCSYVLSVSFPIWRSDNKFNRAVFNPVLYRIIIYVLSMI